MEIAKLRTCISFVRNAAITKITDCNLTDKQHGFLPQNLQLPHNKIGILFPINIGININSS